MTDNCNNSWGTVLGAGLVGYFLGNGGGLFGNNCGRQTCGGCEETCKVSAIQTRVDDIMSGQDTKAILDATIAGDSKIREDLAQINRDNYALGVQSIYNQQTVARNIDKEFCNTNGVIVSESEKTRFALDAFKQLYQTDRYNDLARENIELKNKVNILPLECAIGAVASKLDSIIGCTGVRTCGSACGYNNPYTIPPLTGEATITRSYNPNVAAATA